MKRLFFYKEKGLYSDGFSLVEVLITMAIIGILAGIATPIYLGQRTKAQRAEAETQLLVLQALVNEYYNENLCYYKNTSGTCTDTTLNFDTASNTIQTFLPRFKPGDANAMKFNYAITTTGTATAYNIVATGKSGTAVKGLVYSINQDNNKVGF